MKKVDHLRRHLQEWVKRRLEATAPRESLGGFSREGPVGPVARMHAALAEPQQATADAEPADGTRFGAGEARAAVARSLTHVVDAITDPVIIVDSGGMITHHNRGAADLFPRVRVGQHVSHSSRSPELLSAIDGVLERQERAHIELVDRVPVKRRISAVISHIGETDSEPDDPAVLITFRDFTDQERHTQMRADFVANASHELRTPLASLRGFIETLQGPARDDPAARERFIALMANEAGRMSRLIDDLLTLSRVEMRAHLPPRGLVDLNELAAFVAFSLQQVAEADDTTLSVEPLAGDATVRGDREELIQVLQNLVHNAIKYGRPGGRVDIKIERRGELGVRGRLSISVTDDGIGIAEEHLPRLTERFYRVSTSASRAKGGTGLGLAIVKHILSRHRGELEISSAVGNGSTFRITLDGEPLGHSPSSGRTPTQP